MHSDLSCFLKILCCAQLLRLLGLKKDLNQAAFRKCAEQVETWELAEMDPAQKAEALATARQLVQELASNPSLQGTSLYAAVRDIAFVPASLVCALPIFQRMNNFAAAIPRRELLRTTVDL